MVQRVGVFLPATYLVNSLQRAIFFSVPITHLLLAVVALCFWAATTFFVVLSTIPMGARIKDSPPRQTMGRLHRDPLLILGIYENRTGRLVAESQAAMHAVENSGRHGDSPK